MVKLKSSLWLLSILILGCCAIQRVEQRNTQPKKISEYFNLDVRVNSDTILIGNEITITVIITNKTDSSFYFHPEALVYIDRFVSPDIFLAGEDIIVHYLSEAVNIDNIILLESHRTYTRTYQVTIEKPLVHLGTNKLVLKYMCSSKICNYEQIQEREILYGGLRSSIFEIFVKEK